MRSKNEKPQYKYRTITANCGNDTLGVDASNEIATLLHGEGADFFIINCQEVHFSRAKEQLERAIRERGLDYQVNCLSQMVTRTKLSQALPNTGIASFIIHKSELVVGDEIESTEARRNPKAMLGSSFNKGGLVTNFTLGKKDGTGGIRIQTVSAHLDSNDIQKRNQDWHNTYRARSEEVSDWDELVVACPDLIFSGYDANTRNKLDSNNKYVNLWDLPYPAPEIQALYFAPLAGQHFSQEFTYDKSKEGELADPKRKYYALRGMLDFTGVSAAGDDDYFNEKITQDESVIGIGEDSSTKRDHAVLISPEQVYTPPTSEFNRVQKQIALSLWRAAPVLAQEILSLPDNDTSRETLIKVYNLFLSPEGLINEAIAAHTKNLEIFNQFTSSPFFTNNPTSQDKVTKALFPNSPWFEAINMANLGNLNKADEQQKFKQISELKQLLVTSLVEGQIVREDKEIENRLKLYNRWVDKVKNGPCTDQELQTAKEEFITLQFAEYKALSRILNSYVNIEVKEENKEKKKFKEIGKKILTQAGSMISPNESNLADINEKDLYQLTRVVDQCRNYALAVEANNEENIKVAAGQLGILSQQVSGKSSTAWKALGGSLLGFAFAGLVVVGVLAAIPSGGSSLLLTGLGIAGMAGAGIGTVAGLGIFGAGVAAAGIKSIKKGTEKGLAKSISEYKSTVKDLKPTPDDNDIEMDETAEEVKPK